VGRELGGYLSLMETFGISMMKIMIFLHGTAIMHKNGLNRTREERVKQVLDGDESLYDFAAYIPVGNVVRKLQVWKQQGVEIVYLSSHKKDEDVEKDKVVLRNYGFPDGQVFFRHSSERYNETAEGVLPDILIEDDCESIGGEKDMTYPHIKPELKVRIKSIVVKEFGGIDHLPDDIFALRRC
jgi:hypothetical protein